MRFSTSAAAMSYTIAEVAGMSARAIGKNLEPVISGKYRVGDIRHCFADISKAERILGFKPEIMLSDGLGELAEWLGTQAAVDGVEAAHNELEERGLRI